MTNRTQASGPIVVAKDNSKHRNKEKKMTNNLNEVSGEFNFPNSKFT